MCGKLAQCYRFWLIIIVAVLRSWDRTLSHVMVSFCVPYRCGQTSQRSYLHRISIKGTLTHRAAITGWFFPRGGWCESIMATECNGPWTGEVININDDKSERVDNLDIWLNSGNESEVQTGSNGESQLQIDATLDC